MYSFISFLIGILFGLGLTISNMINPNKILNFLDVTGHWDPTLLMVMLGAVVVTFIGYRMISKQNKPKFNDKFHFPSKTHIDSRLVIGSVIFGIGWGITGYCPGPAITALATFSIDPFYFVVGMIGGSFVYYWLFSRPY